MNKEEQAAWLIKSFPVGTEVVIAASILLCSKCQAICSAYEPCKSCKNRSPSLFDPRFPQGMRTVKVSGYPQYQHKPGLTDFGWSIPWKDDRGSGLISIAWVYHS